MKFLKKNVAFLCAVIMTVSGIVFFSANVSAADTIVYDDSYQIADYWTTSTKTAPVKAGYVFGGWHTKSDNSYTVLHEDSITADDEGKASVEDTVYAKFIPAQVLSVKAQNKSGTEANDNQSASIRVVSAVDSDNYQKVGFNILINNKNKLYTGENKDEELETTRIYSGLTVDGDSSSPYTANEIFGDAAEYFSVWRLDGIADKYDAKIINVTPYWITMDGTKVEGLTRYVHIEDGYKDYIGIPINLRVTKGVAAGTVTITYPDGLTLVDEKVEFEGVFPEATFSDDKNGTIKIVGNAATVDEYNTDKTLLVNLRFTADSSTYPGAGKGTFLTFTVNGEVFYTWEEKEVSTDVWDVKY